MVKTRGTEAAVHLYKNVDGMWKTLLKTHGFIGKNGVNKEKEGDLKTPIGLFEFGIAFGFENRVNTKLEYYKLNESMYWIGDSDSKYYNQLINVCEVDGEFDNEKNEHLIKENVAYYYGIEIKYNKDNIPNKGSAIFLHCINQGETAGCIAIPKNDMKYMIENIDKGTKILIV